MNNGNTEKRIKVYPPAIMSKLKQVQPELAKLLAGSPEFGIVSLELHILNGEIKRIVSRKETSVVLTERGNRHETKFSTGESNTPSFRA
jgi:hypothetical protein